MFFEKSLISFHDIDKQAVDKRDHKSFCVGTSFLSTIKRMDYTFQTLISLKNRLKRIFLATFGYNPNCFRLTSPERMKIWLKALHYFINVTLHSFRCFMF